MNKNELSVPERAAVALGTSEHEKKLRELVTQSGSIVEIKNADARTQCHAAYMVLKNARVAIEKVGKEAREDATAFSKAVIEEQKRLCAITEAEEARLQGLRDEWDEAREAEKRAAREAEEKRLAAIQRAVNDIRTTPVDYAGKSSEEIQGAYNLLTSLEINVDVFDDQCGHAEIAKTETLKKLEQMFADAQTREAEVKRLQAEREELARMRAEQEERDRQAAAARAEQERKAAIARAEEERRARELREQEESDRREAKRRADEAIRAEREAHEAEMQAQRDEIARQQAAIAAAKAEQERVERERQEAIEAEERRKRDEAEAAARAEASRIRAEQDAKLAEQKRREREEFTDKGPGDVEIVRTLASHYDVTVGDALEWLKRFDAKAADEQFAENRDLQTV
ncbi:hypothetical protein QCE63_32255 [Caballeronia sp. LZ065]|uniref:hypothetical protein n=1 Tax=Caballeronia sp. LZ065 TaxID=3038571 RepID=UPI0028585138|nr:hypothetical protein [Caballeronia sp. LZ065]MDR5784095.1 hypothetical protein [Caballeronia sp. LZ065]